MKQKRISALTFNTTLDTWESSTGFVQRSTPMPVIDEKKNPNDAISVLLKIRYVGVCGTDRGIWHREVFKALIHDSLVQEKKTQRILGHEFVGKVLQLGSQVETLYGIKVGDDVSGDSHITCGHCFQCRVGEEEVCQNQKILGISTDGVFATHVKIPAKNLWIVDLKHIRAEIAAMLDPFGNAVHSCSKVDLRGKRVAILGCGPIGMFTILLSRAFGAANIIAVDINKENLHMAKQLGAHHLIRIKKTEDESYKTDQILARKVNELTHEKGVDVSFEMAGPNSSVNNALMITRSGGDVILFGLKDGDFVLPNFNRSIVKGLTLHGVIGRQIFQTWRMLSDKTNGIQEKIWSIMLNKGNDTILPFESYTKERFEKKMAKHPKILIKM